MSLFNLEVAGGWAELNSIARVSGASLLAVGFAGLLASVISTPIFSRLVPALGTKYIVPMRVIARGNLEAFWKVNPDAKAALERWHDVVKKASWRSMDEIAQAFSNAKVLNADRVRFEIAGGRYRLIAAVYFVPSVPIMWIKFIGTHAEYDRVDALTVSQF